MAQFKFLKGNYSGLNSVAIAEGQLLITKDTRELFVDVDASTRIKIGDFTMIATLAELEALDASAVPTSRLYYVEDTNIFCKSTGSAWTQINKDTGATSVEVVGEGNAITDASYDPATRKLTLTKGETFATKAYVGEIPNDDNGDPIADSVVAYINKKTDGIATSGNLEALGARVTTAEGEIDALQEASATHATKDELNAVDAKFANYKTAADQKAIDDEQDRRLGVIEGDYLKAADIADFETKENVKKVADDLAAEVKARGDADAGFETRIAALEGNFGDGEGTVESQIEAAVSAETKAREEAVKGVQDEVDAVEGRMDTAEGKITALEGASANHVEKEEGKSLIADTEIARLANVDNYDDAWLGDHSAFQVESLEAPIGTLTEAVANISDRVGKISNIGNSYTDGYNLGPVSSATEAIANLNTAVKADIALIGDMANIGGSYETGYNLGPVSSVTEAIANLNTTVKADVNAVAQDAKNYAVTITENTDDATVAKTYVFTQNGAEIGSIKLAKELVVTSGSVKEVETADAPYAGAKVGEKYIELVIANQDTPIYVPAKDLVDIYTAKDMTGIEGAEVQVAISNTNEISATLVNGGITEAKLHADVASKLNKTWEEVGVAQDLVDGLANGQVKTNTEAIATLTGKVYTKEEVDAAVAEAVTGATEWGSF